MARASLGSVCGGRRRGERRGRRASIAGEREGARAGRRSKIDPPTRSADPPRLITAARSSKLQSPKNSGTGRGVRCGHLDVEDIEALAALDGGQRLLQHRLQQRAARRARKLKRALCSHQAGVAGRCVVRKFPWCLRAAEAATPGENRIMRFPSARIHTILARGGGVRPAGGRPQRVTRCGFSGPCVPQGQSRRPRHKRCQLPNSVE